MKRIIPVLVAVVLLMAIGTSTAGTTTPKPLPNLTAITASAAVASKPLPKPVCSIGQPTVSNGFIHLVGSCRIGKKLVPPSSYGWRWTVIGETDAAKPYSAPLTTQSFSGHTASVPVPVKGGFRLDLSVKLSTPKTKTHQAASTPPTDFPVKLGGYSAVGTNQPTLAVWPGAIYAYTGWGYNETLSVSEDRSSLALPSHYLYPDLMGKCRWQSVPAEPPTDLVLGMDGTVTTTGLTLYGGKVICTDSSGSLNGYWVTPEISILFGVGAGQPDSCELVMTGVTSFTIPPTWGHVNIVYAHLLTFKDNDLLPDSSQWTETYASYTGPQGNLDPCQAYNLPAWKAGRP